MGALLNPIKGLIEKTNYVYLVEIVVILSIIILLVFIFNALGLIKKPK